MKRGKIGIIRDILITLKNNKLLTKTNIVYAANLNFNRADYYLKNLIVLGFVERTNNDRYIITELGQDYLNKVSEIYSVVENDD